MESSGDSESWQAKEDLEKTEKKEAAERDIHWLSSGDLRGRCLWRAYAPGGVKGDKIRRMWPLLLVFFSILLLSSSKLMPLAEDDPLAGRLSSLLASLLSEVSSCLILIYPASSRPSYLDLIKAEQVMRVAVDSPILAAALNATYKMPCRGYITDPESGWAMLNALGEARIKTMERHLPKILILPSKDAEKSNIGCELLEHHEALYIPDFLLVSPKEISSVEESNSSLFIYTNQFVGNVDTGSRSCALLGRWPGVDINFFPDKIIDLQGKDMKVFAIHYPPATFLQPGVPIDGMEIRFLYHFCSIYNCSISIVTDDDLWGEIYGNGTGLGMSGNVYMDKVDVGIGAYGSWVEEFAYIEYSFPYTQTKMTVVLPKPARLPAWRVPILPFSPTLWAIQVFSIFFAAAIMFAVNNLAELLKNQYGGGIGGEFASIGGTFLRALAMSVLQPPPSRLPSSSPLRKFFTVFEVLFLFFTSIYAGALSSVLTVPLYYPPIDSPRELCEAGLHWAAPHAAFIFSIMEASEPYMQGVVANFESHNTEELKRMAKRGGYGFSIELLPGGHFAQMEHLTGDVILGLHLMKEELYSTDLLFLFRKGSPYTRKLNDLLIRCLDAGMFLLWETNVTATYLSTRTQTAFGMIRRKKSADDDDPTKLQVVHLQGAFILLGLGLAISGVVFLFEVLRPPRERARGPRRKLSF